MSQDPNLHGTSDGSDVWRQLAPAIASFLPANDVASSLRLVDKSAAAALSQQRYTVVRLSLPVPHNLFAWRWGDAECAALCVDARRTLCTLTASSGCLDNLQHICQLLGGRAWVRACGPALLRAAAAAGQVGVLAWLHRDQGCALGPDALQHAAAAGQLEACRWLVSAGCPLAAAVLAAAAASGRSTLVTWLLRAGCPCDYGAARSAAEGGHEDLLDALLQVLRQQEEDKGRRAHHETRAAPPSKMCLKGLFKAPAPAPPKVPPEEAHARWRAEAAQAGLLAAVATGCSLQALDRTYASVVQPWEGAAGGMQQFLINFVRDSAFAAAACSRTADWLCKVQWCEARGFRRTCNVLTALAALPPPEALARVRLLHERGCPATAAAANAAARSGNVEVVRYLLDAGRVRADSSTAASAAQGGQLEVLQLLRELGVCPDLDAAVQAASRGSLPLVAWLVDTFGEEQLTASVFTAAVHSGNTALLEWLHECGCPMGPGAFAEAAGLGSEELLEWLAAEGCPMGEDGFPYLKAAAHGDIRTLRCLRRLGCPYDPSGETFTLAAGMWAPCVEVLSWLASAEGACPVDWEAAFDAAKERPREDPELTAWVEAQHRTRVVERGRFMIW